MAEPAAPAAAPRTWTFFTARLAIIAFVGALGLAAVDAVANLGIRFHVILGLVLIAFSLLKLSVASDAVLRLRGSPGHDPADTHGSRGMAILWIAYKYLAAAVAAGAAVYVLGPGADRVNAAFGG